MKAELHDVLIEGTKIVVNGQQAVQVTSENSPAGETGSTRKVFITDNFVIKLGSIGDAKLFIHEEDRQNFALVRLADIHKKWLIQDRVDCIPYAPLNDEQKNTMLRLRDKYDLSDVCVVPAGRYNEPANQEWAHNWTPDIHGVPVIYDYDW